LTALAAAPSARITAFDEMVALPVVAVYSTGCGMTAQFCACAIMPNHDSISVIENNNLIAYN
jgi:hypothetical protein